MELRDDSATARDDEWQFDEAWAEAIFDSAVEATGAAVREKRGVDGWTVLQSFLTGQGELLSYVELARVLEMSEGGVKSEVSRMRAKFREELRRQVALTVSAPHEIDEELAFLRDVMTRRLKQG